jgi:hypothetical protein
MSKPGKLFEEVSQEYIIFKEDSTFRTFVERKWREITI